MPGLSKNPPMQSRWRRISANSGLILQNRGTRVVASSKDPMDSRGRCSDLPRRQREVWPKGWRRPGHDGEQAGSKAWPGRDTTGSRPGFTAGPGINHRLSLAVARVGPDPPGSGLGGCTVCPDPLGSGLGYCMGLPRLPVDWKGKPLGQP
jgi:hypothetical protein